MLNRFVLSGSYQDQKQQQRPTVEFDEKVYVRSEGYSASLFFETNRMTAIGFSGHARNIRYEDVEGDVRYSAALDHEERTGNVELYYRIFTESDIYLTGGYSDYRFESLESQWRNSYSYAVISGIRFPLWGRARGILSLGYRWLINKADRQNRFSGLIGDTGLEFRLGRFNLRFQYGRDFQFSYQSTNLYFIENRIGSGLSFYLTEFLRLDYDFSYGKSEYDEELIPLPDGGFEEIKRMDTYLTHAAGLVFRIRRNIGIGLTVTYWERDSNVSGWNRSRGFIGGYLTYDF